MGSAYSNDKISPFELKEKRRITTDTPFLLLYAFFFIILLCLLGYCVSKGDIKRIINGYDNCGRICQLSLQNEKTSDGLLDCYAATNIFGEYLLIRRHLNSKEFDRLCVRNCEQYGGYKGFFRKCVPDTTNISISNLIPKSDLTNIFDGVSEDFENCWKELVYLCFISLVCSLFLILLFRCLVGLIVWTVITAVVFVCCGGTIILWVFWAHSQDDFMRRNLYIFPDLESRKTVTYLAFAIVATIITTIVVLLIISLRKRIRLVVQLFEESGKSIAAMPVLLIQPLLTFMCLGTVFSLWFYSCLWIESSGHLIKQGPNVYDYKKDGIMKFTRWYNFFGMLWTIQFIFGCQYMIISGAVSKWYFTRDKTNLDLPVVHSVYNLLRYHLGSVAIGSFIISIVQLARVILKFLDKKLSKKTGCCINSLLKCCHCYLYFFEKVLRSLTKNAYILIALEGHSFCRSGKKAFDLLSSNVLRVAAINLVGDFILVLGKVFVVLSTVLSGVKLLQHKEGVQNMWVLLCLAGLFAYFVAHCFMTVYEMAIDTIFICFCEDLKQNDGIHKPYYMSRDLMEFVENSGKSISHNGQKRNNTAIYTLSGVLEG